eukprot:CAMPEP_0194303360 /NCGR_PEP_ID=MMETSP0171-20130528/1231_1 /TAXON_ID=218684 /ORGANISM="Corethron pennatum, Strain L29A3" /LENGTH=746 /DNA_ID=CAMNT_0039054221 /DNA_START=71 /DNA_END=2312 /DNA_ORIENTATION=-
MKNNTVIQRKNPENVKEMEGTEACEFERLPSDTDKTLIEELLRNDVSLSRVCDLFRDRINDKHITKIAREIVTTASSSEEVQNSSGAGNEICLVSADNRSLSTPFTAVASLPRLGTEILNRSISATHDATFMKAHATNFTKEAPEELLDPLFFTIMNDPVVLSSGYVVDRGTILDVNGSLRFSLCPFTRAPLKAEVYPLICRKRMLKDYRERMLGNMIKTARRLLEERCFGEFKEIMSTAELFIDDLGKSTYTRLSAQLAKISLEAHTIEDNCCSLLPEDLAKIYIRIYCGSPYFHDYSPNKAKEESTVNVNDGSIDDKLIEFNLFQSRIHEMLSKADKAVEGNRLDEASTWLDACEMVRQSCPSFDFPMAKLLLKLAKAKGEDDLFSFQRLVYEEIQSDLEEVTRFCAEEGICHEDLTRKLKPVTLLVGSLHDREQDHEWRCALKSDSLTSKVSSVRVHAGSFEDQNWGNIKGMLGLALYDSDGVLVTRCNLFGTYRDTNYDYGDHPARVLNMQDEVVSMARPGFTYALEYRVGGGGGHSLHVTQWYCKIFPLGFLPSSESMHSYTMHDPEGDAGLFTGKLDRNGKGHGLGELVYYDEDIFIGEFSHGSLKTGVLYKKGKKGRYTMKEGQWSQVLERNILARFPHDVILCTSSVKKGYSYTEEENDSDSDSERQAGEEPEALAVEEEDGLGRDGGGCCGGGVPQAAVLPTGADLARFVEGVVASAVTASLAGVTAMVGAVVLQPL